MKFGQNLPRNQVPEWAASYIDYKALKKAIKSARETAEREDNEADLAGFFFQLDRQLDRVDTFYNTRLGEFSRRLRLLFERYGMVSKMQNGMDKDEMEDLIGTLLELRGLYRKLQWYGEVNRRGFVKITKKLNKKIPSSTAQSRYLATKVDPKQFATNNRLTLDMRGINEWLSSLGDVKVSDDASSVHSGSSSALRHTSSKSVLKMPTATLDALDHAVREDDVVKVEELMTTVPSGAPNEAIISLRLDLLQRAIHAKAQKAIVSLLSQVPSLEQDDDMNKRNALHKLIASIGRARVLEMSGGSEGLAKSSVNSTYINPAEPPVRAPGPFKVEERDPAQELGKDERAEQVLTFVLDNLSAEQRRAIVKKDIYGRMPLHYAAQYGLVAVTQDLIRHMEAWQLFDMTDGIDSIEWQDSEGCAPIHLAVIAGHYRTAKALLLVDDAHKPLAGRLTSTHVEKSGASLAMAVKSDFHKIVGLLVDSGVDVNYQDASGETALHVAAQFGHEQCTHILLLGSNADDKANVELTDKTFGWTPLFTACVEGHLAIVKLLLAHGADVSRPDFSGWTPQEHAALRGHLDIARHLAQFTPPPSVQPSPDLAAQGGSTALANAQSLDYRRTNGVAKDPALKDSSTPNPRIPEPVKEFGHAYLQGQSMVLVSLGSMDERKAKQKPPIVLEDIDITNAHATQLDTALSVVVSAHGADGEASWIDLPIQENISTSPVTFTAKDVTKVKLFFDLVPTYAGTSDKVIGRGVALLSSIRPSIGTKRMNLQGDLSIPLVSRDTLDVIGTVNFNFLIITPFEHPNMSISADRTYWKKSSTMVIGHRGLGKNVNAKTSLQLGENTLQSFITAANLGASYVEFDVQMTKDHVPVIYHDFLVSETGADIPVHGLTLEQFLALGEPTEPRLSRQPSPVDIPLHQQQNGNGPIQPFPPPASTTASASTSDLHSTSASTATPNGTSSSTTSSTSTRPRNQRSYSLNARDDEHLRPDMRERMKHTRDFKIKGFKGNSRGEFIQSPFTTLEELFRKLPPEVGFNIEMKYPMLFESEEQEMDTYAVELNEFVDTVLNLVYGLAGKRNVLFSSFHPDICLLLSLKQPSIPVLFLTDAGASEVGDIRASSLQEAIRFAARWNLLGIVSASEPFVLCPRLINVVKNSNLICFSYGTLNNDAENSNLQAQGGIDAVIVDSVARVRKGLTGAQQQQQRKQAASSATGAVNGADGSGSSHESEAASQRTSATAGAVAVGDNLAGTLRDGMKIS